MRIIHSIPSLVPESGGTARAVVDLCTSLAQTGNSVELFSLDIGERFASPIIPPVELVKTYFVKNQISIGLRQLWAPEFKRKLQSILDRNSADILHDHCIWLPMNSEVTSLATRNRIPLVVTLHGMLEPWALQVGKHKKRLAWLLYQRKNLEKAAVLHATTETEALNVRRLGIRKPIAVVPYIIRLPELSIRDPQQPERIRTILFLSRIHPKKGLLNLIRAMSKVNPLGWQIVIAGPDEEGHRTEVEREIEKLGLKEKCRFLGPVTNESKWDLYREADLFVLPTLSENFGIVVLEALSCGVPVITTTGAPWRDLEVYRCGWWIQPGLEPMVNALQEATSLTDNQRLNLGKNAHKLVHEKYNWTAIAQKMDSVYRWVLGTQEKPDYVFMI
jgi:glycosyltransferase involved in cell wall biosynthesis